GSKVVWFNVKAKDVLNPGHVRILVTGDSERAFWQSDISIVSPLYTEKKAENFILKAGESKEITTKPFGIPGSNKIHMSVSGLKQLNMGSQIIEVFSNPYENIELLISRALIALYLPKLNLLSARENAEIEEIIKQTNSKLKNYMIPGGAFSYWPGGSSSNAWGSIYALLYLNEVAKHGYILTPGLQHECGIYQARIAREWKPTPDSPTATLEQLTQAFRLFTLALAHEPERGAMNRFRQLKNLCIESKWFLAAAYGLENKEAGRMILESISNQTNEENDGNIFSSDTYLGTLQLSTFIILGDQNQAYNSVQSLFKYIDSAQYSNSTTTIAFALMTLYTYLEKNPTINSLEFDFTYQGKTDYIDTKKQNWIYENRLTEDKPEKMRITNKSSGDLYVKTLLIGNAKQGEQQATANGMELKSCFRDMSGKIIDVNNLPLGMNFIYEITVTNTSGVLLQDVVIEQPIPAGWEISNSGVSGNGIMNSQLSYQNIRDNNVISFVSKLPVEQSVKIPVYITTSYAGKYYFPPAFSKNMYRSSVNASTAGREVIVNRSE
ncbi:MAG: hypothetical protein ACRCSQ_10750, partial [Bacteroidales bacterium]